MPIHGASISPFGIQKMEKAREVGNWGEYVGRMTILVRLIDAQPHLVFGSHLFDWPEGSIRSPRAELVRACLEWCRVILMKEGEYILGVRVLLSIALPQVKQVIPLSHNPTEHDVRVVLAELLCGLQLKAFFRWEKDPRGDMGARLLEWVLRNKQFLHQDTEYIEALQFLYLTPSDVSVRQAQVREALRRFQKKSDTERAKQAAGLLLPNSDTGKEFDHSEVGLEPLSACVSLEILRLPYFPVEHLDYYEAFVVKKA